MSPKNKPAEHMLDVQTLLLIDSFLGRRTASRLSADRVVIYRLSRYTRKECEELLRSTLESWGVSCPETDLKEFTLNAGYTMDKEQEQVHKALLSSRHVQVPLGFSDASKAVALKQLDLGTFCVCPKTTLCGKNVSIWCSKLIFKADVAENERGVFGLFAYERELLKGLNGYPGQDSFESLYQLRIARDIAHRLRQGVMEETAFRENFAKVESYVKEESEKIDEMVQSLPHISLCLDGGGARGEFSAAILAKLMERLNAEPWIISNFEHLDLVEIFDDLHGTSAGAILAAALWSDLYTVQNVPWEFFKLSRLIFAGGPKTDAISFGLIGIGQKESLYSALTVNDQIIRNLSFWEAQVSPLMRPIFPCLSIHTTDVTYNPYLPIKINTHDDTPIIGTGGIPIPRELKLADYVRASMAAPGYLTVYPVATVLLGQRTPIPHVALVMADGGIMNNNPGLSSLSQNLAKVRVVDGTDPDDNSKMQVAGFTIISIGTGYKRTLQADPIAKVANLTKMSAQTTNDDMHLRSASKRDPTEFKYHRFQFPTNYDALDEPRLEAYNEYQTIAASDEVKEVIEAAVANILPALKLKKQLICARRKFRRDLLLNVQQLVPTIQREHLHELAKRKIVDTEEGWFSVMGCDGKKLLRVNNLFSSQPLVQLVNIELDNANHAHSTAFYSMSASPPTDNVKLCALLITPQGAEPYYLGWAIGGPSFKVPQHLLGLNCVLNAVDVNGRFELHHPTFDSIKVRLNKDSVYVLTEDSVVPACLFALA